MNTLTELHQLIREHSFYNLYASTIKGASALGHPQLFGCGNRGETPCIVEVKKKPNRKTK